MFGPEKTSYRAKSVPSPSMSNEWGYYNRFHGFHGTTDPYAYFGLLWLVIKTLHHPKVARWVLRQMWRRWVHRSCDTTDFHHDIYCDLDPWVRKRDAQDRWREVWTGKESWQ